MKNFYLGIDVGTDSAGMACTDENYRLLRMKGKDAWCVRLFDEASDASERRQFRTARRRLQRRRQRIDFLQELFLPYISDRLFFLRLDNSGYLYEDKDEKLQSPYSLFADADFSDKQFYKRYPTVFHLRKSLIESSEPADLRLYYLAIHHIIKYRGHFLFEGQSMNEIHDIKKLFEKLNEAASELFDENTPVFDENKASEFKTIAFETNGLNDKKRTCAALFGATGAVKEIISLMLGGTGKADVIFGKEEYKGEKLCFKNLAQEEFDAKEDVYGDDFEYIKAVKGIYDYIVFEKILDGKRYISDAMAGIYEKHKRDLKNLKKFVLDNFPYEYSKKYGKICNEVYNDIFKSTNEKFNYVNYIGYTKIKKTKTNVKKIKNSEIGDFYKYLKKKLDWVKVEEKYRGFYDGMISDMENENFLPKIINADNGKFPYQINLAELSAILKNMCRDYPAFEQKGDDGLSVCDKINAVFTFRIPYYVGPLGKAGKNRWAVRKKEGRITPWNFSEMIDDAESNKLFMRRMTNKCEYLHQEEVLPKYSIIYQKYNVLNQINSMSINGQPISVELKQAIFNDLFLKYKKVSVKNIKDYIIKSGSFPVSEQSQLTVTGIIENFSASMSSYINMKNIFGDFADRRPDICENIILWHTLNTDKNIVERLITDNYGNISEVAVKIKELKKLTCKDFCSLSGKFLTGLKGGVDFTTGEALTILDVLYKTNQNLNQILYNENYHFKQLIEEENGIESDEITVETLEDFGLSPQVRRAVWQTLIMADEYVRTAGKTPDKIFVEVTRFRGEKGKTTQSRKDNLLALYKNCKDIDELVAELNGKTDAELRQERLYLYFLQLGRCAYSGRKIDLESLAEDTFDVDHIMPQALIKDDSIDNKVLVFREYNSKKSDRYPIPEEFRKMKPFWKQLKDRNLMSEKKYGLLTRTAPLDESDLDKFIARQIVVTGQTAKAVAELLKKKYPEAKVVYSKGENVSDFKNKFGIIKCRDTNDLHHARDAYLNIVVGNVFDTKFSNIKSYYKKNADDGWRRYKFDRLYERDLEDAWDSKQSLADVKKTVSRSSMMVTRYTFTETGGFYDQTVYGKNENVDLPRKGKGPYADTSKYGGYKSLKNAYFVVVQSTDKKKVKKTIESIPVIVDYRSKTDPDAVMKYLTDTLKLTDPKILIPKIKIKSLVTVNGTPVYLAGKTGNQIILHNAVQWHTDGKTDEYVNALSDVSEWDKAGKLSDEEKNGNEFKVKTNRSKQDKLTVTAEKNKELYKLLLIQLNKPIYDGLTSVISFRNKITQLENKFAELTVFKQAKTLLSIISVLKCNASSADLSLLGEGNNCGKILIGKNITDVSIELIHQSPCGLTERRRKV